MKNKVRSESDDTISCRICGSELKKWSKPWLGFVWGRCRECCSVQKVLNNVQYDALNPSYDPGYLEADSDLEDLTRQLDISSKMFLLRQLVADSDSDEFLDIGCGMGGYLLAAKQLGYHVTGVEPSASHSKAAVEIFGLDVMQKYFSPSDFEKKFDVVLISHVIEHILHPGDFISDVLKVVKPGGKLVIITPNCGSIAARVCSKYWSMYKPIDHVSLFTPRALEKLFVHGESIKLLETHEWRGEFAAHLISAAKTALRPEIANVSKGESKRSAVRRNSLNRLMRTLLAFASLPFFFAGSLTKRQSCIYAVVQK